MSLTKGAGTVPVDLYVVSREMMEDPTGRLKLVVSSDLFLRVGGRQGQSLGDVLVALGDVRDKSQDKRHQSSGSPLSHEDELPEMPVIPSGRDVLLDGLIVEPVARIFHLSGVFTPASDWSDIKLVPPKTKVQGVQYRTFKTWMLESMQSDFGVFAVMAFLMIALFAMTIGPVGIRPGWQWSGAACFVALGILGLGLHHNSANTVCIEESRLANAAPGSPESFTGLLDTWLRSLTKPP